MSQKRRINTKGSSMVAAAAFVVLAAASTAQMQHDSGLSASDQKFLREAAQGGMAEVELGRLATEKAASTDVKSFGQQMVDDHGKANDRLKALATAKSFDLPDGMSPEQKQMRDKLSNLSGASFDREYMKHMVMDHKKDVAEFEKESQGAKDAEVKAFATSTLPTLKDHLKMAQEVAPKVGAR